MGYSHCGLVVEQSPVMRTVPGSSPSSGINAGSKLRLHDAPQASYLSVDLLVTFSATDMRAMRKMRKYLSAEFDR